MKNKTPLIAVILSLALVIAFAGCGGSETTTTTTTTSIPVTTTTTTTKPTTTTTTTATTTTTTTTTSTTSTPAGNPIPTTGVKITTHNAAVMASYNGLCLMCHGQGTGVSQYPLPPSYTSRSLSPGTVYVVDPGVPGDHTGRTDTAACTGCHGGSTPTTTTTAPTTTTSTSISTTARVITDSTGFNPANVTIAVGGTVTWYNPEHEDHNITSDDDLFEADISGESTYEFTFNKVGTYHYHDKENPSRTGTITVV